MFFKSYFLISLELMRIDGIFAYRKESIQRKTDKSKSHEKIKKTPC
jgi:hypothetical protein